MPVWMVIEDEVDINQVILSMFEVWGFNGFSFEDGNDVMTQITEVETHPFQEELPELALSWRHVCGPVRA